MIVQMTRTRNELFLIKELLPVWQRYADGFCFMVDRSTDGTYEFLLENKDKYNILSVIIKDVADGVLEIESDDRQRMYDEALKFSGDIICLDTDEYLDGTMTKVQLQEILNTHRDTLLDLRWVQYTNANQIRVDGPWKEVWSPDRVGAYDSKANFRFAQMHSQHMPYLSNQKHFRIGLPHLFIAHLQWLDKRTVGIKQYYWKVIDYVNRARYNAKTIQPSEYDVSVNNFVWKYEPFPFPLRIATDVYKDQNTLENYKFRYIRDSVDKYNIPNLNDWGMGIHQPHR